MGAIVAVLAAAGLLIWLTGRQRDRAAAPEDDRNTPVDRDELAAAERELAEDPDPRTYDAGDEEDDWGPGAA